MRYKLKSSTVICSWAPRQCPHAGARQVEKGVSTSGVRQEQVFGREDEETIAGKLCSSFSS